VLEMSMQSAEHSVCKYIGEGFENEHKHFQILALKDTVLK
jgi:hypothetical protein